jgi:hypothetical protein
MVGGQLLAVASASGHHGPRWLGILIPALVGAFALATVINPKLTWKMNRWQYKNPSAMEPSSAALMVTRVVGCITIVVAIVIVVITASHL